MESLSRLSRLSTAPGEARPRTAGFTLIEMLIVLAIIMVLVVIALTSQSSFNRSFLLSNTAYDIALTMRGAQNYGVGGRTIGSGTVGYGLDFQKSSPTSFLLFADSYPGLSGWPLCHETPLQSQPGSQPGDCRYTAGQDTQVASYTIGNGISIEDLCVYVAGPNAWECASNNAFSQLDIVFARPNAVPYLSAGSGGTNIGWLCSAGNYDNSYVPYCTLSETITKACIKLTSANGGLKVVEVNAAGEITANGDTCS